MGDYIALAVIVVILAAAIIYLVRAKKSGAKCIGCPYGKNCVKCKECSINENEKT